MITTTWEPDRDRFGRPIFEGRAWTRPSTLAGALDDKSALVSWKGRQVAEAILADRDLLDLGDPREIVAATEESDAAAFGTEVHRIVSEALIHGEVPNAQFPEGRCARAVLDLLGNHGLEPLASELTVLNRDLQALGTADLLLARDGAGYVGDIKTSSSADGWRYRHLSYSVQLATYAGGDPIIDDGAVTTWSTLGLPRPDQQTGFVIHVHSETAVATLLQVDLDKGRELARNAVDLRATRATRTIEVVA